MKFADPPLIEVGHGMAREENSFATGEKAAKEALAGIASHPVSAVLVFASVHYDLEEVLSGICGVAGEPPIFGASTAGEICDGSHDKSVVVTALASPHLSARIGVGRGVSRDWRGAVHDAVKSSSILPYFSPQDNAIWDEMTQEGESAFGIVFAPGKTRHADSRGHEVLEELTRLSHGRLPMFGGCAADDWLMESNYVFLGNRPYPDSLLVAVFRTSLKFGIAMAHGFQPSSVAATATSVRDCEILELNNRPAGEVYAEMLGVTLESLQAKPLTLSTGKALGICDKYGQHTINVVSHLTARRGVLLAHPIAAGTVLTVMEPSEEEMLRAGQEALHKAMLRSAVNNPAAILVCSSALRSRILGEQTSREISRMKDVMPDVPLAGFHSLGEIGSTVDGVNRHNHQAIAVLLLGQELSYPAHVAMESRRLRSQLESSAAELLRVQEAREETKDEFELRVRQRTADLVMSNEMLRSEIIERKRAAQASVESGKRYRLLFDNMLEGLAYCRMLFEDGRPQDFVYLLVNASFEKLTGLLNVVGKKVTEVIPGIRDSSPELFEIYGRVSLTGSPEHFETYLDSLGIWFSISAYSPEREYFVAVFDNITDRKKAEERLEREKAKFKAILDSMNDGVYIVNDRHEIEYTNPKIDAAFGPVDGRKCYQYFHSLSEPCPWCKNAQVFNGESIVWEWYSQKTGRTYELFDTPIGNDDGSVSKLEFFHDITDRKQAEEALRETERRYRDLWENAPVMMVSLDSEARISFVSDRFCQELGYDRNEVLGKTPFVFQTKESAEYAQSVVFRNFLETGLVKDALLQLVRKNGEVMDVVLNATAERDSQDNVVRSRSVFIDITERNRAERALRQSEERFRVIAEAVSEVLWMADVEIDTTFYVSPAYERVWGRPVASLYEDPQSFLDAVHEEDRAHVLAAYARKRTGQPFQHEFRIVRPDGQIRWIRDQGFPVSDENGKVTRYAGIAEDITEHKKAEEELRVRDSAIEASINGFGFANPDGIVFHANSAFVKMWGFDGHENVVGLHISDLWDDRESFSRAFAQFQEHGHYIGELRGRKQDGTTFDVQISASTVFGDDEKPLLIMASLTDITDRKRAEEALRESEERFRHVAESAGDWIWEVNPEGLYRFCSPAVEKILGYSRQELEGQAYFFDLFSPDVRDTFRDKAFEVFTRKDRFRGFISPNLRKDGTIAILETSGTPILDDRGDLLGYRGVHKDVTEERRMQEAHRLLAKALEQTADCIVITDSHGFVVYVNPAFENITGLVLQDLLGKKYDVVDLRHNRESLYHELQDTLAAGGSWAGQVVSRRKGGALYEESVTVAPVYDDSGKTVNFVVARRDISEALGLLRQLAHAQKLEAIGTLAGGIAHDFNNMLFAMTGYTELAMDSLPAGSEARRDLKQVLRAGERAGEMVKQILTFSRQGDPERKPLNLTPIIKEGLKFLRASIPTTIEIRQNIQPDLGKVYGDPTQIHQVLMNFCTNSAHAMQGTKGVLSVELAGVELDREYAAANPEVTPGKYVRLTVSDTGHGIPSGILDRIFEPYFTTKKAGEGTGLGLSVVHGIVKSHGGAISVYTEINKGTTFHVYLPEMEENARQERDSSMAIIPTGHEHILLVDDELILVEMGQSILERLGYEVETETNPTEALELFRADPQRFDLVITDLTMPKMTGDDLASDLIRIRRDIPIILCTGFSEWLAEERLEKAGIAAFIRKPFLKKDIARVIREVLDRKG